MGAQLINSCKIKYSKNVRSYTIGIATDIRPFKHVTFKFDTGATSTIITVNSLFENKELVAKAVLFLNDCFKKDKYISETARSASGTEMKGILCSINNFVFEGLQPFKFYFYLVFSTAYPKALLGVDFISCCDYSMLAGQDIEVSCFHESRYSCGYTLWKKEHAIDIQDLLKILDSIVLTEEQRKQIEQKSIDEIIDSLDSIDGLVFDTPVVKPTPDLKYLDVF